MSAGDLIRADDRDGGQRGPWLIHARVQRHVERLPDEPRAVPTKLEETRILPAYRTSQGSTIPGKSSGIAYYTYYIIWSIDTDCIIRICLKLHHSYVTERYITYPTVTIFTSALASSWSSWSESAKSKSIVSSRRAPRLHGDTGARQTRCSGDTGARRTRCSRSEVS